MNNQDVLIQYLIQALQKEHMRNKGAEHTLIVCWTCDLISRAKEAVTKEPNERGYK